MRFAILVALLLLRPHVVTACSCGTRPSALEALPLVSAVFDGTALSRTPFLARIDGSFTVLERTEFLVHQAWRGPHAARLTLVTGFGNCDFLFQVGTRYVVFASPADRPDLGLGSSICLPTTSARYATRVLSDLGPGLPFAPATTPSTESRFVRGLRIAHSSVLWGVASSLSAVNRPSYVPPPALRTYLIGPVVAVAFLVASVFLAFRRRFRLLAVLLLPFFLLVLIGFAAQGYLLILSSPLLSHWLLKPFYGV